MSKSKSYDVAVVGATGAVGECMLDILASRNFPVRKVHALASERSVGKRYAELNELGEEAQTRATLEEYSIGYLRMLLSISLAAVLISYCVWAFETSAASTSDWPLYELSIVPMLMALLRYLLVLDQGQGAAPEEVFTSDHLLVLLGFCWIVVYGLAVYVS